MKLGDLADTAAGCVTSGKRVLFPEQPAFSQAKSIDPNNLGSYADPCDSSSCSA
jgi:hypothetical protein